MIDLETRAKSLILSNELYLEKTDSYRSTEELSAISLSICEGKPYEFDRVQLAELVLEQQSLSAPLTWLNLFAVAAAIGVNVAIVAILIWLVAQPANG
jgi:hypothetical protein